MNDYITREQLSRDMVKSPHERMEAAQATAELCRKILLVESINRVFRETLTCESEVEVARVCLAVAEKLTGSEFGLLGEVNQQGRFDAIALSDPGWKNCRMPETQAAASLRNMEIRGIWAKPILQEKSVIVNHPASDPDRVGVPEGHPPITCFLGVPLKLRDRTIGLIALANREGGYDRSHQEDIEALAVAFTEALYRKRIEDELHKAHDELEIRVRERTEELAVANQLLRTEIAEHEQGEESLRDSERSYRRLLAAVTADVYTVRLENGVPVTTEYGLGNQSGTGFSPADYAADPRLWISMVHPDDREMVQQHVEEVLAGKDVPAIEHRIIHRDGTTRWIRNTIVSHRDRTGRLVCYNGVIEDITQHKWEEERRKRDAELLAARTIQEHLLPDGPPRLSGFDIAGMVYPAEFTAGDYFDYLPLCDGQVGFVVADVSGHGIGPALIAATTQAYLRSLAEMHTEVDEILKLANAILCSELKDNLFVTLLLAKLDPGTRSFAYSSAGHPAGYIIGSSGEVKARLESTGLPLGIKPDTIFPVCCPITLEPGDLVLLFTDGLLEARSPENSSFGIERAIDVIRNNRDRTAREIVASVYRALQGFSRRDAPLDDVTIVAIKVQPAP